MSVQGSLSVALNFTELLLSPSTNAVETVIRQINQGGTPFSFLDGSGPIRSPSSGRVMARSQPHPRPST